MDLIFHTYALGQVITFFGMLAVYSYRPDIIDHDERLDPVIVAFICSAFWPVVWFEIAKAIRDRDHWN